MEGSSFSLNWKPTGCCAQSILSPFIEFLKGCEPPCDFYHVMFRSGSVVRLDGTEDIVLFQEFNRKKYTQEFPHHRLEDNNAFQDIFNGNCSDFKHALALCKNEAEKIMIKRAYTIFIGDGYPLPGGAGADTNTLPISKDGTFMMVLFTHRNLRINMPTLMLPSDMEVLSKKPFQSTLEAHDMLGRQNRRLDFMFPRVYAIIDGTTPHILDERDQKSELDQ